MKDKFKKIMSGMLSLAVLLTFIPMVNATEAPQSMTVKRTYVMGSYIGYDNDFTAYATTDGTIVYCMDLDMSGATSGTSYTYSTDADAGLLYIIENGYPNKSITNSDEVDQYITQSAVWWYLSDTGQTAQMSTAFQTTDKEAYSGIRDEIKKLVEGAKNAEIEEYSINLQTSNTTLKLSNDEQYYESSTMNATVTGDGTYTVTVSGGTESTIITDEEGNAKSEFTSGENFKIMIPSNELIEATQLTVTVSAVGSKSAAVYAPSDSSFQRVVSTEIYTKNATDSVILSVTPSEDTPGVEIIVPNTSANIPFIILGVGFVLIIIGFGIFWYITKRRQALSAKK